MNKDSFVERVVPGRVQYELWQEHLNRYVFASNFVSRKVVLDVACGVGYGAKLMTKTADLVVGIDTSRDALTYARKHYAKNHQANFVLADANNFPFRENSFDVVVSFETIEHLIRYERFLQETQRSLKARGRLIISTPNGKIHSSPKQATPRNPFHFREFSSGEFSRLMRVFSADTQLYGQCSYTLKDLLYQVLDEHLPQSLKSSLRKTRRIKSSTPQIALTRTSNSAYRVRKIRNLYPVCSPRFLIIVVQNEKRGTHSLSRNPC